MRFLVTNDDGIDSAFLHALIGALRGEGHELFVVAPRHEQSWVGAAKSRSRPVHSAPADKGFGCPTWVVDGTPSDCVNIALAHLVPNGREPSVDGVVSGINVGVNASLGFVLASGTLAGAWEGALHGLPAIAFSQDVTDRVYEKLKLSQGAPSRALANTLAASARHAARLAATLLAATAPSSFIVHNVNFPLPCTAASILKHTVPARLLVPGLFSPQADDGTHRLIFRIGHDLSPAEPLTDRAALAAGWISHSILDYTRVGVPPSPAKSARPPRTRR
jgi:5'-nucleotidase